jgi:hypothetical protein
LSKVTPDRPVSYAAALRAAAAFIESVGEVALKSFRQMGFPPPLPVDTSPLYGFLAWMRITFLFALCPRISRDELPWGSWLELMCASGEDLSIPLQAGRVLAYCLCELPARVVPVDITLERLLDMFEQRLPDASFDMKVPLALILCWIEEGFGNEEFHQALVQSQFAVDLVFEGASGGLPWSSSARRALFSLARDVPPESHRDLLQAIVETCQDAELDDEEAVCLDFVIARLTDAEECPA